jgi:predicted nucleic acid-binding protein
MRGILLDTSAFSAHRRGHPEIGAAVKEAPNVALNAIVLGELLHGFRAGSRSASNLADLARLRSVPRFRILALDEDTADYYARLIVELRRAATPIPTNDIWIAASAMQHGLEILTTDRHFLGLPMLAVRCFDAT